MSCKDAKWIQDRIARTEEMIVAYEDAILALSGGAQSYTLDTGQTRQVVSKADLSQMRSMLATLENRRAAYRSRLCGSGRIHVIPGF